MCIFQYSILAVCMYQHAMSVMGINEDNQFNVLSLIAGVLHLGNIDFVEHGNYASVQDPQCTSIFVVVMF